MGETSCREASLGTTFETLPNRHRHDSLPRAFARREGSLAEMAIPPARARRCNQAFASAAFCKAAMSSLIICIIAAITRFAFAASGPDSSLGSIFGVICHETP